jgi:hypothetical protein
MKKPLQHLIAEVPRKRAKAELTIGIALGDVWSHYCTLNQEGEVVDRGRFRTTAKAIEKWFAPVPHARVAMEAGVHSIWISEQLEQLGHDVIVANVRELRAISHSDRKSDDVDAEKLARYSLELGGKLVRGKEKVVSDGPFVEAKDVIGGYILVEATDLNHATELAKRCPILSVGGSVEVRAVQMLGDEWN